MLVSHRLTSPAQLPESSGGYFWLTSKCFPAERKVPGAQVSGKPSLSTPARAFPATQATAPPSRGPSPATHGRQLPCSGPRGASFNVSGLRNRFLTHICSASGSEWEERQGWGRKAGRTRSSTQGTVFGTFPHWNLVVSGYWERPEPSTFACEDRASATGLDFHDKLSSKPPLWIVCSL